MRSDRLAMLLAFGVVYSTSAIAQGAISGLQRTAGGLSAPVFATHAPGDTERLFVLEKGGEIKIVDLATNAVTSTFLDITDTDSAGEGGLLGLAFHPEYSMAGASGFGKFYVYVTVDNGGDTSLGPVSPFSSHIREYSVSESDPNHADANSKREILSFVQPQSNHNAGWIGFSPVDNYLYVMSGDGGGGNDNDSGHTAEIGNAQDVTNNFLGKALRIDVNGDDFPADANRNYAIPSTNPFVGTDGDDEIWAYGLRNPYRASFDRLTGDLWIGDVGQSAREEIDFQPASSDGGENYGWRLREGDNQTPSVGGPIPPDYVAPVYDYRRSTPSGEPPGYEGEAVNGGYIYRGPDPDLQGLYFFSDSDIRNIWHFDPANPDGTVLNIESLLGSNFDSVGRMVSFGEDAKGNVYIVDYGGGASGEIWRIATDNLLVGDFNADGHVDNSDFSLWHDSFGDVADGTPPPADANGNGVVDAADYTIWRDNLGASVHDPLVSSAQATSNVPEPTSALLIVQLIGLILANGWHVRRRRR